MADEEKPTFAPAGAVEPKLGDTYPDVNVVVVVDLSAPEDLPSKAVASD